jgi:hypothetical protein
MVDVLGRIALLFPTHPQLRDYVHVIFLGQRLQQDAGNTG